MADYFKGYYYKHQKDDHTLCLIPGQCNSKKFIQILTEDFSAEVPFTEGNIFSRNGVKLEIHTPQLSIEGELRYRELSPVKHDIMGPFRFFSMECRHGIVSMQHRLEGKVKLNGEVIDFTHGKGYIEWDSGRSFPSSYAWVQANDFQEPCAIMAAVASIPFCGTYFQGCICVIQYRGKEYRLATYLGAKVRACTRNRILLKQGKYTLEIRIKDCGSRKLSAPRNGKMTRTILEAASCSGEFIFYVRGKKCFHLISEHTSFEYERQILMTR